MSLGILARPAIFAAIMLLLLSQNSEMCHNKPGDAFLQSAYAQNTTSPAQPGTGAAFPININGTVFVVQTASGTGAKAKNVTLDIDSKTMTIQLEKLENQTRIHFMNVVFRSELVGGRLTIMYDGEQVQAPKAYFMDIREGHTIILFNFPSNIETISITGTRVAPEFSTALLAIVPVFLVPLLLMRSKLFPKSL